MSAAPLLYYTLDHATLGAWEGSNPTYGAVTGVGGVAVIAGTRTALYFGRNGMGQHCYGNGTADRSLDGKTGPTVQSSSTTRRGQQQGLARLSIPLSSVGL